MHQIIPVTTTSGAAHGDTPNPIVAWPPVIGYAELSVLLGRTVGTLQADRVRRPESLPPASTPPGSRTPRWITADVIDWLRQYREHRAQPASPVAATSPRRRGRPTKREQIERKRAAQEAEGGV